jgi:hypothetical protein
MSSSNHDPNAILGIKVSWEMKSLLIVSVFAAIKALKPLSDSILFLWGARVFFLAGHAFLVYIFFFTNYRITMSKSRSVEEKNTAKSECQSMIRSLIVRASLIGFVHMRTSMLPPLFVTVLMGFLSMIENDFCYQVLYAKMPFAFELLFA